MKKFFTFFLLLLTVNSFAQLTIKPTGANAPNNKDNYVYVSGTVLYVKKDIKLEANSSALGLANIYLRKEGQLIQSSNSVSTNSGDGVLSVFQEGTVNQYDYNYWASPVGIENLDNSPANGNLRFGRKGLYDPETTLKSHPAIATDNYDGETNPLKIATYWINTFYDTGDSDYFSYQQIWSNSAINTGTGFTMKGVDGTDPNIVDGVKNNPGSAQRYDFRGRPNSGKITLIAPQAGESVLVGNPYPSAINLNYFLIENSSGNSAALANCGNTETRRNATTGIAYFWNSDPSVASHNLADYNGGYGTFSPAGDCNSTGVYAQPTYYNYDGVGNPIGSGNQITGSPEERSICPIGQGFFVKAPENGNTIDPITFRNDYRLFTKEGTTNESVFQRTTVANNNTKNTNESGRTPVPKLRLNIAFDDLYTRQPVLAFSPIATTGVDIAMDAENINNLASDAGFMIDSTNYVIDIRPFDEDDRIPLTLNLDENRDLAFNINNFEDFDTEHVYIYDTSTNKYHPIKNNYFYITLAEDNYDGRFELTFKDNSEELSAANETANSFRVFQNNKEAQLEINNPELANLKSVQVFDMTGKLLINKQDLSAKERYVFSTARFAQAIYVVSITTKENIKTTRKITVSQL